MKIIIGIATYKREKYLQRTLESLSGQADEILVYDNNKEKKDYKANAKFIFLNDYSESEPIYYFACDDDIIYPPNYVNMTIKNINKYSGIVTYHGDILLEKNPGAYPDVERFHFKNEVKKARYIDIAGTGLTAFRTDYFYPTNIYKDKRQNMVDQLFSLEAAKQNKRIILAPHAKNLFVSQPVPANQTIWGKHGNKRQQQILLANEILRLKNEK